MFFQSIYQMLATGTDLSINIRRTDTKLSVVVMPRRTGVKDEAGQFIVPLVLNGTAVEMDDQFLQAITTPLQKAQGILINLETFEKQVQQATAQSKAAKSVEDKEGKEAREKQKKMEKLIKKSNETAAAGRYQEATMWLKQARALVTPDKQKEIDILMQEVQKKATEGSLFAETVPQARHTQQQPPVSNTPNGQQAGRQMQMFTPQPEQQTALQPMYQSTSQPLPQPQMVRTQPAPQIYQSGAVQPQPTYGGYYQQPAGQQVYITQPGGQPQPMQQWQHPQPIPQQPHTPAMPAAPGSTAREYHSQPQSPDPLCFDKDDESDRERLREDPYSEYIDFPEEYRRKDEAQTKPAYC
ncbi:PRTRC system protein E [Bacteroides reticulotermitis]|uniref:ParB-related ThiF-related cassette protein E domain-containing protein n=2 Tax=Bacteroides reticulotermitis TaxID=1133319 RepID=W4UVX0_9BACE|nr:PRTRC system protein E [Bacteroides reticulotermitis]MBB4045810.1 PRTRC genetic system protein E [Bacteroides reticulotermitis]GAE84952.1 hypothetical protein JCM10512_3336 [Bacteroides reticulotermitis JCM 10512]